VLVDEIGGREDEDLAHLSGCCWLPLIKNLRKAMVMAVATLIGSVLPALPFIFGASLACVLSSVAITIVAAGLIGYYRGYAVTYLILLVVATLTVGLSIAVA